jgi:hypothetical protein
MKPKFWALMLVIALLAAGAYYAFVPGHTPAGQPPLAKFERTAFDQQFRAAVTETRLLVLLSPT